MDPLEQAKTILLGSCEQAKNNKTQCIKKMLDDETVHKKSNTAVAEEMEILRKRLDVADMASEQLLPIPPQPQSKQRSEYHPRLQPPTATHEVARFGAFKQHFGAISTWHQCQLAALATRNSKATQKQLEVRCLWEGSRLSIWFCLFGK